MPTAFLNFLGGHKDLKVFQMAYRLAMEIFHLTKSFPTDEKYSLTGQIRRSSRSVAVNIAEGSRRRQYPNAFSNKMSESDAEARETLVWLEFSRDCVYITATICQKLVNEYEQGW
jgi:four helix bundle protein